MVRKLGWAAAVAMLACTGCASVDLAKTLNGQQLTVERSEAIAHVNGDCWGVYLLNIVPLVTGRTTPTGPEVAFFQDTVTVEYVTDMTTGECKKLGASKTVDLASHRDSVWIAPVLFFWYKDVQVSGSAIK